MKYDGKDQDGWCTVLDGDQRYAVTAPGCVEDYTEWIGDDGVVVAECLDEVTWSWVGYKGDPEHRKLIIACAWPMYLEKP